MSERLEELDAEVPVLFDETDGIDPLSGTPLMLPIGRHHAEAPVPAQG